MAELFFMWCGGVMSVVAVLGLIGWLVKPRLVEWIRVEVLEPVQMIKKQVTENHHSNPEPTVLDLLSDVKKEVRDAKASVASLASDQQKTDRSVLALTSIVGRLDGKVDRVDTKLQRHLTWSKSTTDQINGRLDAVEQPEG